MNSFAQALQDPPVISTPTGVTANGMPAHVSTTNDLLDLFFVIGSSRNMDISDKFIRALTADPLLTMRMLFWARDVRGGAGERDTFRKLLQVLEAHDVHVVEKIMYLIPEYGRWDDLEAFQTEPMQKLAALHWANGIRSGDALAAKWANRKGPWANLIRKALHMDPKTYRKTVKGLTQVVETHMCAQQWDQINYSHVPSVASSRYAKAFGRHDPVRYTEFKASALKGLVKINSHALYPYDVLKNVHEGDPTTALAQWENLPNYLGDAGFILPLVDTSGSMTAPVGGQKGSGITCMDVAVSLGLYLADKQQGPFAHMFLNFDSHSKIHVLKGNLLEKMHQLKSCAWGGSTNLESAFKEILRVAVLGQVPPDQMPRTLLVITDLGFNPYTGGMNHTAWQMVQHIYTTHNYQVPQIVWWNVAHASGGYGGDRNYPVQDNQVGAALVSGFSPSILKSVLSSKVITPWEFMLNTIQDERYDAVQQAIMD
jgi:hypothetical protein